MQSPAGIVVSKAACLAQLQKADSQVWKGSPSATELSVLLLKRKKGRNICEESPPFYFPWEYLAFRNQKGRVRNEISQREGRTYLL